MYEYKRLFFCGTHFFHSLLTTTPPQPSNITTKMQSITAQVYSYIRDADYASAIEILEVGNKQLYLLVCRIVLSHYNISFQSNTHIRQSYATLERKEVSCRY